MITRQFRPWLGATIFSISALVTSQALAVTGTAGKFSGTRGVVHASSITTAFTTIPGIIRHSSGGTANDEVVVTFQASWSGTAMQFDTAFVRLTIDGAVQPTNVSVPIFAGSEGTNTHGFTWISSSLAPGSHTARIQWRTDLDRRSASTIARWSSRTADWVDAGRQRHSLPEDVAGTASPTSRIDQHFDAVQQGAGKRQKREGPLHDFVMFKPIPHGSSAAVDRWSALYFSRRRLDGRSLGRFLECRGASVIG